MLVGPDHCRRDVLDKFSVRGAADGNELSGSVRPRVEYQPALVREPGYLGRFVVMSFNSLRMEGIPVVESFGVDLEFALFPIEVVEVADAELITVKSDIER